MTYMNPIYKGLEPKQRKAELESTYQAANKIAVALRTNLGHRASSHVIDASGVSTIQHLVDLCDKMLEITGNGMYCQFLGDTSVPKKMRLLVESVIYNPEVYRLNIPDKELARTAERIYRSMIADGINIMDTSYLLNEFMDIMTDHQSRSPNKVYNNGATPTEKKIIETTMRTQEFDPELHERLQEIGIVIEGLEKRVAQ